MKLQRLMLAGERLSFVLLLATLVALHFDLFSDARPQLGWLAVLRDAGDLSHVALLGIWAGLCQGRQWIKWPAIAAIILLLACFPPSFIQDWRWGATSERWLGYGPVLLFSYASAFALLAVSLKLRGFVVAGISPGETSSRLRFSIRSLLILTIVAAAAVRGGQLLYGYAQEHEEARLRLAFAGLGVVLAASAGLTLWATLAPGRRWARLMILAASCPALALIPPYLGGNDTSFSPLAVLIGAHAAVLAGALLVVNACGYRVSKRSVLASVKNCEKTHQMQSQRPILELMASNGGAVGRADLLTPEETR